LGIYLEGSSNSNIIRDNRFTLNDDVAIELYSSPTNNDIINNSMNLDTGTAIFVSSNSNRFTNNTMNQQITVRNANYNNFTNNVESADYNNVFGGIINNSVNSGIYMDEYLTNGDSVYNYFEDLIIENSTTYDVYLIENSNYHTFLNVTYDISKEQISDGKLIRKWYVDAQVNDSVTLNPIQGVNVSNGFTEGVYYGFNTTTDANGEITTQKYVSYRNWDGTRTHYNITFEKTGYGTNSTNYTGNQYLSILLTDNVNPLIEFVVNR